MEHSTTGYILSHRFLLENSVETEVGAPVDQKSKRNRFWVTARNQFLTRAQNSDRDDAYGQLTG